ncbi:cytochrome c peroxidase [Spirosoma sordidisoli]|uniref:Cytochrome-c peroxidase n=1 Tax=Spirosoma sordidisoli TaxID=2502893 RepID=A0A4Q2URJ8_9BACT|nr:cytochrome c peroxidase [Spirosoma sordidisoli]RYC70335.1 cytochrome-c peroxidase [Spirosoma sordidisoli]
MVTQQTTSTVARQQPRYAFRIGIVLIACLAFLSLYRVWTSRQTPLQQVKSKYLHDIAQLDSAVRHLNRAVDAQWSEIRIQAAFDSARLAYKQVEFLVELYNPETAKSLNGPALPEVEEDDGLQREIKPEGFQVIEELVFPYDPANRGELRGQLALLQANVGRLTRVATDNEMTDSHVFDAIRLEVFRLVSLGITGFDSPVANHSLPEAVASLQSLHQHLRFYDLADQQPDLAERLDGAFAGAIGALQKEQSFTDFDRFGYITQHANVLSGLLLDAQQALGIPVFQESRLLSASARTLNDRDAFDPNYFVNSRDDRATPSRIALGKMLFYDPILSGDANRSCATCHQPDKAFTDGEPKSLAVGFGGRRIARNAPTLVNAALQAAQFADSRVTFLEDQASDVIENADEMHGSLPDAVKALRASQVYQTTFSKTYRDGVTEQNLKNAIASYVRSLTSLNSRVDRALRNEKQAALSAEEKHGFNLFMGKAKCATCHFYPLFNGTVPPAYQKTESEVLGTPATADNNQLDPDLGKFRTTGITLQKHAFKTPTVRNVAQTAPYMHNGVYQTLDQVIDFYNKGGGNGLGLRVDNQTLLNDKLNLTPGEKKALIAFLNAL